MSRDNDPFAGVPATGGTGDQTVIVPRPGGQPLPEGATAPEAGAPFAAPPRAPASPPPETASEAAPEAPPLPETGGLNPLEQAASHLLNLIPKLRGLISHPDPEGLRRQVIHDIQSFEQRLVRADIDPQTRLRARYVLCTALDEAVLNTPWGNASSWNRNSLLVSFHNEAGGGERFFLLLDHLLQNPASHLHLLELMYLCLALGFQGRYGVDVGGRETLEQVRDNLYRSLRGQRGDPEPELSVHWHGVEDARKSLVRFIPAWAFFAVAGLILAATFMAFDFRLNAHSDPVLGQLSRVDATLTTPNLPRTAPPPPPPTPTAPPLPTLSGLLADDLRAGRVAIEENPRRAHLRVLGGALFTSGRAVIATPRRPLFGRIAAALGQIPGPLLITGHTDAVPIRRSLRFASNWALSQARAEAVAAFLAEAGVAPGRLTAEGRADTNRLPGMAPTDGRNRRVEIELTKTPGGPALGRRE